MATYYFSGINKPLLLQILAKRGANGMVNALSAGQAALRQAYESYPTVELALDSGACQGNRKVESYARLIRLLSPRMTFCSNLDVLHNQQLSDEHFHQLHALLADDVQARRKLLWIYQCQSRGNCWHRKGDLDLLKRSLEHYQFIGIGGIRSVIERDVQEAQDLLGSVGEILDAAGAQAHAFGIGNYALLLYCLAQRWFRSADSARWQQGFKSRMLLTTEGKVVDGRTLMFSGIQCAEQNIGAIQAWIRSDTRQLFLFPK